MLAQRKKGDSTKTAQQISEQTNKKVECNVKANQSKLVSFPAKSNRYSQTIPVSTLL